MRTKGVDELAETVSITFQFAIGDAVTHRLAMNPTKPPFKLVVVERVVNQCYGGTQILYQIRQVGTESATNLYLITEPELVAYPSDDELREMKAREKDEFNNYFKTRKEANEAAS